MTSTLLTHTARRTSRPWESLLRTGCLVVLASAGVLQAVGRFVGPSLVVLMVGVGVALLLLRRAPRAAAVVAGVFCLLNLLIHAGLLFTTAMHPEVLLAHILNVVNILGSLAVVSAVVPAWRRRGAGSALPGRIVVAGAAVLALSTVLSATMYLTRPSVTPAPDDVVVTNDGTVSPAEVTVSGQDPALVFVNDDPLFPRSFDIDELDIHVALPPNTARRVELPATPGSYEFYDLVTFTDATGGTLTITE